MKLVCFSDMWHHQRFGKTGGEQQRTGAENHTVLLDKSTTSPPFSCFSPAHTQPLLFLQCQVNVMWQCNDFWVFPLFESLVRVLPKTHQQRLCLSVRQNTNTQRPLAFLSLLLDSCNEKSPVTHLLSVWLNSSQSFVDAVQHRQIHHWSRETEAPFKWLQTR